LTRKGLVLSNNKKIDSPIQYRNRCKLCGRPRGYYRKFGLCRICFRKLAHEGKLPGVVKASW
jgi:small subunit ribosomal protein S14